MKFSFTLPPGQDQDWAYDSVRKYAVRLVMIDAMRDIDLNLTPNTYIAYGADFNNHGLITGSIDSICKLGESKSSAIVQWMEEKLLLELTSIADSITEFRRLPPWIMFPLSELLNEGKTLAHNAKINRFRDTIKRLLILIRGLDYRVDGDSDRCRQGDNATVALPKKFIGQVGDILTATFNAPPEDYRNKQHELNHCLDVVELAVRLGIDQDINYFYEEQQTDPSPANLFDACLKHSSLHKDATKEVAGFEHLSMTEAVCLTPGREYKRLSSSKELRQNTTTHKFLLARWIHHNFE